MIDVVEYRPAWPARFAELQAAYGAVLDESGAPFLTIEHVGSTAVPHLAAKPVIDADIVVGHKYVDTAIAALARIGFVSRGDLGVEGRTAFVTPERFAPTNTYVMIDGCLALRNHLAVRDVLRSNAGLREDYGWVKRRAGSEAPDGTGEWAEAFAAKESRVKVLKRAQKEGLGPAYIAGFTWALSRRYNVIVEMDADGSHQPEELPSLLEAVANGADLAIGTRWIAGGRVENWPWYRQFISRAGTSYARTLLGSRLHDLTSGYRAFARDALESLDLSKIDAQGYAFQIELAWQLERAGATIVEIPITFVERLQGRSKMSSWIVVEAFLRVTGWRIAGRNSKSLTTDKSSAAPFQ